MKKFREFRRQLLFIGKYRNGKPAGNCWEYREGGGFIYGEPDDSGKFTGDQIAFIYPDLETALVGRFVDGVMVCFKTNCIGEHLKFYLNASPLVKLI